MNNTIYYIYIFVYKLKEINKIIQFIHIYILNKNKNIIIYHNKISIDKRLLDMI